MGGTPEEEGEDRSLPELPARAGEARSGASRGADPARGEKAVVLGLMTSVTFGWAVTDSILFPFLPLELDARGLRGQQLTGLVYAVFPFTVLVLSPLCKVLAGKCGRLPLLYAGVPLQAVSALAFGLATRLTISTDWLVGLFFLLRAAQGFGVAMANLAVLAIAAETFPGSLGKVMGANETVMGLGVMLAPVIGSPLYSAGGFVLPFLVGSGIIWLSFPFVVAYHRQIRAKGSRRGLEAGGVGPDGLERSLSGNSFDGTAVTNETALYSADDSSNVSDREMLPETSPREGGRRRREAGGDDEAGASFWAQVRSVLSWRLVLSALVLFFGTGAFVWVESILSLHLLDDLGMPEKYIGISFAAINLAYLICGPFVGALADRCGYKPVMTSGLMLTGLAYILMGPVCDVVGRAEGLRDQRVWQVALLGCFGASNALAVIPTLPAMKESVAGEMDEHRVNSVVMVFSQFQQSSLLVPLLSSVLSPAIGWADTMLIYGALCLGVGAISASLFYVYGSVPREEGKPEGAESYEKLAPLLDP